MSVPLLAVEDLTVDIPTRRGVLRALDKISFTVERGEVLGIVGESGAGKSLTGAAITGLLQSPARLTGGRILLEGERIDGLPAGRMRRLRGGRIGSVFQESSGALDPLCPVGRQLIETMQAHLPLTEREARARAIKWLEEMGIPAPDERFFAYPHEFSGGMRQRLVLALALCAAPALIIADEPTTALDVSIQAQIVALLQRMARHHHTAIILVTHDIGVIAEIADRAAVMYAGRIIEIGPVAEVIRRPAHPYTQGLIETIPSIVERVERLRQIEGSMPRLDAIPDGCPFHPRCPKAFSRCRTERPDLMAAGPALAACWLNDRATEQRTEPERAHA